MSDVKKPRREGFLISLYRQLHPSSTKKFTVSKTYQQIHEEIRAAQEHAGVHLGALAGITWLRFIPGFLFRIFIKIASKNIHMMKGYGAVGVTAIGMFGRKDQVLWPIPIVGGATVAVAVGGIMETPCISDG